MIFLDKAAYAEEIDGIYSVVSRDLKNPAYKLFTKNSEIVLNYITLYPWKFYRENFTGKQHFGGS